MTAPEGMPLLRANARQVGPPEYERLGVELAAQLQPALQEAPPPVVTYPPGAGPGRP